ncbi:MAG: ATP-binding protein [Acidobacteriota bacterium]|nr:ATP-binding protein [Acidobacteriota bacterium]
MPVKILVVDDEADLELLINQKFRREIRAGKFEFDYAANGVEALEVLDKKPEIELVLTDINMPEMDGLTLIGHITRKGSHIQTIVVSAYGDMENIRAAMNRGAYDFLTKPIDFEDLKITVDKTVRHIEELKELRKAELEKQAAQKKALEEEAKARKAQHKLIEHLQKMDRMKDEFLANTSHELRTPINGIIGIVETVLDGHREYDEATRANLSMVIEAGRRLTGLVDDILDYSKMESGKLRLNLQPLDLAAQLEAVLTITRPLIETRPIELLNKVPEGLPAVSADPNRLHQVLFNLLGNAGKFTNQGSITITAEVVEDAVAVHIEDTGIGIPREHLANIFKTFQQIGDSATRSQGGVGLGLAITRGLVELGGGRIWVESKAGVGSTFSFTVPVTTEDPTDTREIPTAGGAHLVWAQEGTELPVPSAETILTRDDHLILAVDDEPVNRQVLRNQLTLAGYRTDVVANGHDALKAVEEKEYDLIILDVMMPGISGLEVCASIRKTKSLYELPILMLTARSQLKDFLAGLEAGANDYLTKPFDKRELLARMKTLLTLRDAVKAAIRHQNDLREEQVRTLTLENEKAVLTYRAEESARAEAQAKEVSQQKTDFLALMSHELRTPLNAIIGYSEILQEDMTSGAQDHLIPDILKIQKSARNLLYMINNLLDLTKIEAGKMDLYLEDFRLSLLFEEVTTTIKPLASKNSNKLEISLADGLDMIHADITKLRQVMLNLLSNACKFTESGIISISADTIQYQDLPKVRITVSDTGIGMSSEQLSRLFRPFTQADKSTMRHYGGTGLGLTICKRFCEMMNGEITVESEQGKGTTFHLIFPPAVQT